MTNWIMISLTLSLFIAVMVIFSLEKLDYVAYSLLLALISCLVTSKVYNKTLTDFIEKIEFTPLIFIFSMQIIILITEKYKIYQWVAVKALHLTKGNHRFFFYLICTISTLLAAIIADITVAIIFIPLVIRACRILKIEPAPYLFGITITINIGSIMTPFSSSENILIASLFQLDFLWFFKNTFIFATITLLITLFLLDILLLRKEKPPEEIQKKILLEIMDPNMVIIEKKTFILNSIYFITIIIGFIFASNYSYIVALFGAILVSLLNRNQIGENIAKIDWKLLFFYISLFLLIGNMEINGTFDEITKFLLKINLDQDLLVALGVLIIVSLLSGFLANSPTAILTIQLLYNIYNVEQNGELMIENIPPVVLIAFLFAINLGGNLLPQGAACDVMTLNIAKKNNVKGFSYNTLLKKGGTFALIHILLCSIYIILYYVIT